MRLPVVARLAAVCIIAAAAPLAAQADRHPVAPGNNWSVTPSSCAIDAGWDGGGAILITLHEDHHDLGWYDKTMAGVVDGKVVPLSFDAGGPVRRAGGYAALGHRAGREVAQSYVADVDDALLDRIAEANALRITRSGTVIADLDMTGFAEALQAMRRCEHTSSAMTADGNTEAADINAAQAAADAAAAAAEAAEAAAAASDGPHR